jgi:hypothetical protein
MCARVSCEDSEWNLEDNFLKLFLTEAFIFSEIFYSCYCIFINILWPCIKGSREATVYLFDITACHFTCCKLNPRAIHFVPGLALCFRRQAANCLSFPMYNNSHRYKRSLLLLSSYLIKKFCIHLNSYRTCNEQCHCWVWRDEMYFNTGIQTIVLMLSCRYWWQFEN